MTKTFLAQNEFISGAAALVALTTVESEAASLIAPHDAVTLSDGVCRPSLPSGESEPSVMLAYAPSEAATVSGRAPVAAEPLTCGVCGHNPVTQALEIRPALPVSSEPNLPAVSNSPAQETAGSFDELTQLIGVAGRRRRRPLALPRFVPDKEAMWDAMHNPSAPRALETDPVWADEPPLFLRETI